MGTIQPEHEITGALYNNMTTFVVDPSKVAPSEWFGDEYDKMVDYIRSSPAPFPDEHPILISGEPERMAKEKRSKVGIEISDNEWRAISEAGKLFGLTDNVFWVICVVNGFFCFVEFIRFRANIIFQRIFLKYP